MSKIHILEADGPQYEMAIHINIPTGTNSAGETWKDCWIASGRNTTILAVGTAPGQITQAENDDIIAGDVIELLTSLPAESGGSTQASLNTMVDAYVTAAKDELKAVLKYFGYTQG